MKYSSGPADLLVFSEHENYCHIVDARKYSESQVRCSSFARAHSLPVIVFTVSLMVGHVTVKMSCSHGLHNITFRYAVSVQCVKDWAHSIEILDLSPVTTIKTQHNGCFIADLNFELMW